MKKIYLILIFIISGCSNQSSNLERCVEKNKQKILNFDMPVPEILSKQNIRYTKDVKNNLMEAVNFGDIDQKIPHELIEQATIFQVVNQIQWQPGDLYELNQILLTGDIDEKEKEFIKLIKKFYKSILMEFPELLEISAEEICNSQGVY